MTKELFKAILKAIRQERELRATLYKLNIDIINLESGYNEVIQLLIKETYNSEGVDWFNWYVYDKGFTPDLIARDENVYIFVDDDDAFKQLTKYLL